MRKFISAVTRYKKKQASLYLTNSCTLKCAHCDLWQMKPFDNSLDIRKIILSECFFRDYLNKKDCHLFGGEYMYILYY